MTDKQRRQANEDKFTFYYFQIKGEQDIKMLEKFQSMFSIGLKECVKNFEATRQFTGKPEERLKKLEQTEEKYNEIIYSRVEKNLKNRTTRKRWNQ